MKKQKTILIDFEFLIQHPDSTFNAEHYPPPRKNIEELLQLLSSKYRLLILNKNCLAPMYLWCERYRLTKYFAGAVRRKRTYYLHIEHIETTKIDLDDIAQKFA